MEYPHWLMVAGAILVGAGFIGLMFRKNNPQPLEDNIREERHMGKANEQPKRAPKIKGAEPSRRLSKSLRDLARAMSTMSWTTSLTRALGGGQKNKIRNEITGFADFPAGQADVSS